MKPKMKFRQYDWQVVMMVHFPTRLLIVDDDVDDDDNYDDDEDDDVNDDRNHSDINYKVLD